MNMKTFSKNHGLVLATAALCLGSASGLQGATVNVSVVNNSFSPASVTANVGDTVLWTWPSGSFSHNVTSTSSTPAWTPSATENGPVTFSHTFTAAGSYPYECTIHAACCGMVGSVTINAAPKVPPTVAIINPTAGAVFRAPANVTLQATASSSDATITSVQFLNGSTVLATVTSAPYTTTTGNLAAGNYTLSAVATDSVLLKSTNSVSIIVDAPPVVAISSPVNGTVFSSPANVTIQATASSPGGGSVTNVQFLVGSTVISNRQVTPFVATASNLTTGNYTLAAIASDNFGVQTTNSVATSVVTPVSTVISALQSSPGRFQFSYAANAGLSYVVQKSTNLTSSVWVPLATNQAAANPVIFVDTLATNSPAFYRVDRLPNP